MGSTAAQLLLTYNRHIDGSSVPIVLVHQNETHLLRIGSRHIRCCTFVYDNLKKINIGKTGAHS